MADATADDGSVDGFSRATEPDSSADGGVLLLRQHSGATTRLESVAGKWNNCHTRLLD
jgi:hypothetical protein